MVSNSCYGSPLQIKTSDWRERELHEWKSEQLTTSLLHHNHHWWSMFTYSTVMHSLLGMDLIIRIAKNRSTATLQLVALLKHFRMKVWLEVWLKHSPPINNFLVMGVDISVWRARIGSFNLSVRRFSGKRAKPTSRATNGLEVALVATIVLLILAGDMDFNQLQQRNSEYKCVPYCTSS